MGTNLSNSERPITLGLLKAINENAELTQRSLANELGIALGLVNTYLKRCINKGYVKTRQIPRNRYAYYLTPKGFAEKSKLTAEYLYQSLSLFRQAHDSYRVLLSTCSEKQWRRICLCGGGDLADILILLSSEYDIEIVGILDPDYAGASFHDYPVYSKFEQVLAPDVWIVTSSTGAQEIYDQLVESVPAQRILAPDLLEIQVTKLSPASVP